MDPWTPDREMASRSDPPAECGTEAGSSATVPRGGKNKNNERAPSAQEKPNQATHPVSRAPTARRRELCPRRQLSQRERERERDASATLTRPITDLPEAHELSTALFPKKTTRATSPISVATRSLSTVPSKALEAGHEAEPKPVLCSRPVAQAGRRDISTIYYPRPSCQEWIREYLRTRHGLSDMTLLTGYLTLDRRAARHSEACGIALRLAVR
jgi:hypothetical protein